MGPEAVFGFKERRSLYTRLVARYRLSHNRRQPGISNPQHHMPVDSQGFTPLVTVCIVC
jgi:hypothetical protein